MTDDSLMTRARSLWSKLASVPVSFPSHGSVVITVSPVCPATLGFWELGDQLSVRLDLSE